MENILPWEYFFGGEVLVFFNFFFMVSLAWSCVVFKDKTNLFVGVLYKTLSTKLI